MDSTLHNTFCSQTQCFVTSGSALTNITRIVGLRADKDYALFWWNKICPPHLSFAHCCQVSTYFLANLRKKFSKMQNPYGHRNFFANSYFLRPLLKYLAEFSATWQQCFCHESDTFSNIASESLSTQSLNLSNSQLEYFRKVCFNPADIVRFNSLILLIAGHGLLKHVYYKL